MLDVVEDHFEVLVVEGGSRSSESSCERWRHVIVSPSRSALLRCWSRYSPHRLQGWTCSRLMMQYHDVRENQILALCVCVCIWFHGFPRSIVNMHDAIVFTLHGFPRSIWRTKFFLQTLTNNLLRKERFSFLHKNTFCVHKFPRSITDWIGFGLGWFGKFSTRCFSKRLFNEFPNWLLFNCRTRLIIPFSPIVIVFQWDLWWWSRRQISSFIQHFSSFQSFNFWNTMGWKCPLKNNCIRSCLIEC